MFGRFQVTIPVLAFCFAAGVASAQTATGAIEGRVLDGETGDPLPGATVVLEGSSIVASTDRTGTFRVSGAPVGDQTLRLTYLGSEEAHVTVTVRPGVVSSTSDVKLSRLAYTETVEVTAEVVRGAQARALNQQKTAPNITNVVSADQIGSFPDPNAAETTQRIPGVSISRDRGSTDLC